MLSHSCPDIWVREPNYFIFPTQLFPETTLYLISHMGSLCEEKGSQWYLRKSPICTVTRMKDKPNTGAGVILQEIYVSSALAHCCSPTPNPEWRGIPQGSGKMQREENCLFLSSRCPRRQKVCQLGLLGAPSEPVAPPSLLTEGHTASCLGSFSSEKDPGGLHTMWANSLRQITMLGWEASPKAWSQKCKKWET